jgi:hypothetical protein
LQVEGSSPSGPTIYTSLVSNAGAFLLGIIELLEVALWLLWVESADGKSGGLFHRSYRELTEWNSEIMETYPCDILEAISQASVFQNREMPPRIC